jgi:hypothetical protein
MLRLGIPDDGEEIATHAARHRLHESERSVRSDGRVDSGSAFLQHIERYLRGERLHGRSHAVLCDRRRARRERRAHIAVAIAGREALNRIQTCH